MGRTHRRHSYRRSKRWNPSRYQSSEAASATTRIIRRGHRNPGGITKYLRDGKIHVSSDGDVTVSDSSGVRSTYRIPYGRLGSFISEVMKSGPRAHVSHYVHDDVLASDWGARANPKRRGKRQMSRRYENSDRAEAYQRGRETGMKFDRRGRRRNPKIRRSEARAMKRVLKRHGYNPRRGRRHGRRHRSRR